MALREPWTPHRLTRAVSLRRQLGDDCVTEYDYCFGQNGLEAFKAGECIGSTSIKTEFDEATLKVRCLVAWARDGAPVPTVSSFQTQTSCMSFTRACKCGCMHQELINFILHYIADLDIPVKRGTFIEFRIVRTRPRFSRSAVPSVPATCVLLRHLH